MPRPPLVLRMVRARPRLFSSAAIGIAITVGLALTGQWRRPIPVVVGWDIGVAVYLVLAFFMMTRASIQDIRRRAADEAGGQFIILVLPVVGAVASLYVIG